MHDKRIAITLVMLFAHSLHAAPQTTKLKLLKTDQSTWNTSWRYGFSNFKDTQPTAWKHFKKNTTASIEPGNTFLWVCIDNTCKPLDVKTVPVGNVVAISKDGTPTITRETTAKSLIAATKVVKIPVYKTGTKIDTNPWTITSVESTKFGNKPLNETNKDDIVHQIVIKKNPFIAPKLKIPWNRQFFIQVIRSGKPTEQTLIPKQLTNVSKQVLTINEWGNAAIVDKSSLDATKKK